MENNIPQKGFYFDNRDNRHKYYLDGKLLAGVTTILKTISPVSFDEEGNVTSKTDMLMAWAVKLVAEACDQNAEKIALAKGKERQNIIAECKRAYKQTRDKAAGHGTDIHAAIEAYLKDGTIPADEQAIKAVEYVKHHLKNSKVLYIEKQLYSRTLKIAGTCDLVFENDNGEIVLADFKTSSRFYPEMFWQIAGYSLMLREMQAENNIQQYAFSRYEIIHLPKTGDFNIFETPADLKYEKAFRAALDIYRISLGQE
jgi:hypothetical protein